MSKRPRSRQKQRNSEDKTQYMHDKLTRSDIEKMEKEIEERKLVKRPELIEAVKEARATLTRQKFLFMKTILEILKLQGE